MKNRNQVYATKAIALAIASCFPLAGQAQSTDKLENIVITAERRETKLQDTPLAVTAFTADAIERQPFTDILQLGQRIAAITFTQRLGVLSTTIRGIGGQDFTLGGDQRVAFHSDGVYVARGAAQASALYDVERFELVQGPQGTLYGRNATAGAINVITKAPTREFSGYANETLGNYNLRKENAAVSGPASDQLSFRLATEIIDRDGYGRNVYLNQDIDDQHSKALRGSLRWRDGGFQADVIGDYYRRADHGFPIYFRTWVVTPTTPTLPGYITSSAAIATSGRDSAADINPTYAEETKGVSAKLRWKFNDNLSLQSLTGYRKSNYSQFGDSDTTNLVAFAGSSREASETVSQEFQLNGNFERTRYTAGLYAFNERVFTAGHVLGSPLIPAFAGLYTVTQKAPPPAGKYFPVSFAEGRMDTRAYAVFAEATHDLTDAYKLTLGGRYTQETKSASRAAQGLVAPGPLPVFSDLGQTYTVPDSLFPPKQSTTWNQFTPNATLEYIFSPAAMAYVRYSEGFKSGSYGLGDSNGPVEPEKLKDFEGGVKTTWWDGRMRANANAFHYDYSNLQVSVLTVLPTGAAVLATKNAAAAKAYGVEFELAAQVTSRLGLNADVIVQHSTFTSFMTGDSARPTLGNLDLSGYHLPQSPSHKATFGANYTHPLDQGKLKFNLQATVTGKFYFTPYNQETHAQAAYTTADASVEYLMANGWTASLWGNNLSDKKYQTAALPSSAQTGNVVNVAYGAPRTLGVKVGYNW